MLPTYLNGIACGLFIAGVLGASGIRPFAVVVIGWIVFPIAILLYVVNR